MSSDPRPDRWEALRKERDELPQWVVDDWGCEYDGPAAWDYVRVATPDAIGALLAERDAYAEALEAIAGADWAVEANPEAFGLLAYRRCVEQAKHALAAGSLQGEQEP